MSIRRIPDSRDVQNVISVYLHFFKRITYRWWILSIEVETPTRKEKRYRRRRRCSYDRFYTQCNNSTIGKAYLFLHPHIPVLLIHDSQERCAPREISRIYLPTIIIFRLSWWWALSILTTRYNKNSRRLLKIRSELFRVVSQGFRVHGLKACGWAGHRTVFQLRKLLYTFSAIF